MKTKISAAVIALFFLMGCGSSEQKKEGEETTATPASPSTKFTLKAVNMMYLAIQPDSTLKANQPDPTKAEVFEKIDLEGGKVALKASNGKFVSDNRAKNSVLDVFTAAPSEWEQFEILALDPTKINIRTSAGKFVSSDPGQDGIVTANSKAASDWEAFSMEVK